MKINRKLLPILAFSLATTPAFAQDTPLDETSQNQSEANRIYVPPLVLPLDFDLARVPKTPCVPTPLTEARYINVPITGGLIRVPFWRIENPYYKPCPKFI